MDRILAISDIHGCYDEFNKLLGKVNYSSAKDQLILLGDYIDRGTQNKEVVSFVRELVDTYGAIALRGNHDQMFIDFVKRPYKYENVANFIQNGGVKTLESYIKSFESYIWHDETYKKWTNEIMMVHSEDFEFMDSLPYYYELDDYVFVHAGINPMLNDWRYTGNEDFVWIRELFLNNDHGHDKTFIHGHTPCKYLHNKHDIYFGNKKIGIDGACAYGGQLNCLEIKDGEFKQYSVESHKN